MSRDKSLATRVVMAVNNPATNDYRVVKSAEMVARAGFDCHVVGVLKPGFAVEEVINGVTYHRVKIKTGLLAIIGGYSPDYFLHLNTYFNNKQLTIADGNTSVKFRTISWKNKILFLSLLRKLHPFLIKVLKVLKVLKMFYRLCFRVLRTSHLSPNNSVFGVKYLYGRYLASFYNKLLMLDGDIYHAHELWMLESCSIVALNNKAKLIYDSHELELHRNNKWSVSSNRVRCDYEKIYIHRADTVFAVSNGCAKEIAKEYDLDEVLLLRNTPLLFKLKRSKKGLRENLGLTLNSKLLIYTGSITFNRGVELILQALVQLQRYELVTIGPWNEQVKEELNNLASELAVQNRFYMHPKVPPEELISLMSEGNIAVVPIKDACLSYRYCMPNKLFEAAFAGLPLVVSDLPDMKEFVIANELGLVFQNDNVDSLVETIVDVERVNLYKKIQLKKEQVMREYCFEKESEILIEQYRKLVGEQATVMDTAT